MNPFSSTTDPDLVDGTSLRTLQRLQLELALDFSDITGQPLNETLAAAAQTVGADLLFALPPPGGLGLAAVLRIDHPDGDHFLQVATNGSGFRVAAQEDMDRALLGFARAQVEVLRGIGGDETLRGTLTEAAAA